MSWGPNLLIKQGAKLVQEWNDIVSELEASDRRRLSDQSRKQMNLNGIDPDETSGDPAASTTAGPMSHLARAVLKTLKPDAPTGLDHLIETAEGTSASEIIAILFELELAGLVRQVPGKSFLRVWAD